jgi:AcrR family transcriptional regulator
MEKRSRRRLVEEKRIEEVTHLAEQVMQKKGIHALTLQELIDDCSISRGTFYKQFPSKETLITYLGIKALNFWAGLLDKAEHYDGLSRERLMVLHASHVLCHHLNFNSYQCIFIANSEANRIAVSPELNTILDDRMHKLIDYIQMCVELAVQEKNLELPDTLNAQEMAFFIWSGRYGAALASSNYGFFPSVSGDLTQKYKEYTHYLLDKMGWAPLTTQINYERVLNQIFKTFYKSECMLARKIYKKPHPFSITEEVLVP